MQIDDSEADNLDTGASEAALNPQDAAALVEMSASRKERQSHRELDDLPSQRDAGKEPSGVAPKRRGRSMNETARKAFAEAVVDLKKQVTEQGANVDEFDDYDFGEAEPAPKLAGEVKPETAPAASAAAAAPRPTTAAAAPAQPTESAAAPPPAPSLDPQVLDKRRQLDDRERELVAREQALQEREANSDVQRIHDAYGEQPVQTVMDLIKRSLGLEKDEDIRGEVADLVSALSGDVLGVELPSEVRAKMLEKQTKRIVKNHERRLTLREQELERKRLVTEAAQNRTAAIQRLTQVIPTAKNDKGELMFPWLAAEGNPGDLVADIIETQLRRDHDEAKKKGLPTDSIAAISWTEAAKRGNDYLERQYRTNYEARKNLFNPGQPAATPAPTTQAAAKPAATIQGDPAGIVGSRSLTNVAASQPSAAPPAEGRSKPADDADPSRRRGWSNDRHRANTRRSLRAAFRAAETQEE